MTTILSEERGERGISAAESTVLTPAINHYGATSDTMRLETTLFHSPLSGDACRGSLLHVIANSNRHV